MSICYYVYAPRYVSTSAGIRGLYELVKLLRDSSQEAWIVTHLDHLQDALPKQFESFVLTFETALSHKAVGKQSIVIYSETIEGNPLRASIIVRYVMNTPGLLGGPAKYSPNELVYAFSETLAEKLEIPGRSLFIPLVDEGFFRPARVEKTLTSVYAAKYVDAHKGALGAVAEGATLITRDQEFSQDRDELLDILQRSKVLYLFENSAIAIEAALCGCVVIFKPNPYLTINIGAKDHGDFGMAWGEGRDEIERAFGTISRFRESYLDCKAMLPGKLAKFIQETTSFRQTKSGYGIDVNVLRPPSYYVRASAAAQRTLRSVGFVPLLVKAMEVGKQKGIYALFRIICELGTTIFVRSIVSRTKSIK